MPFNSETLVTGKLFEDIREAVFKLADPALYDAIVVINLCVPTASGVPLDLLPKEINGVRDHRHRRARLRRADPCRGEGRAGRRDAANTPARRPSRARCRRRAAGASERPTVTLIGEMFPADPVGIGAMLEPLGPRGRPGGADARMARALCRAGLRRRRGDPSVLHRISIREFDAAGRPIVGSAPVGRRRHRGLARSDRRRPATSRATRSMPPRIASCRRSRPRWRPSPIDARITVSGYEGSELLVARLLIESGADVPYVGTACPRTPW